MCDDRETLVSEVIELYERVVRGPDSRIDAGERLWCQFQEAVSAARLQQEGADRQLRERINELATAKYLADDTTITGAIAYEPEILPSKRKIDFVVERCEDRLFVEVKSVYPKTPDTEAKWNRYRQLSQHHPENVNFLVEKDCLGGEIYGNAFAARSKFLEYSLAFEQRLKEARSEGLFGPGILVFCGSGFHWRLSDREDFSDFYHSGHHRADDPFSHMEQHELESKKLELLKNISHFAFLSRANYQASIGQMHYPVEGPALGK